MIQSRFFFSPSAIRLASIAFLCCSAPMVLTAQPLSADGSAARPATVAAVSEQPLDLQLHAVPGIAYSASSSSSSADSAWIDPVAAERLNLSGAGSDSMQPPPRRRYGRPRYTDRMHNADGSSKLAIMAGGGFNVPTGDTRNYLSTGYNIGGGIGVNFDKNSALLLQVGYDHFGLPGQLITAQRSYYESLGFVTQDPTTGITNQADFSGLGGSTHIWSMTLNPTFNFYQGDSFGAYAVVGGGFYHKVTDFTLPSLQQGFDYFYGPYTYTANSTFDHYTSNSAGLNGGIGFTWKPSRFASERLFAEARFVHTFDHAATHGQADYDFYPANHLESNYIPVTFGIRF